MSGPMRRLEPLVQGLVATRLSLRSLPANSIGSAAARAEQWARSRWDNEGGAIPRQPVAPGVGPWA